MNGVFFDIYWVGDAKPHWCALPDDANPDIYNMPLEERLNLTIPLIEKDGEWIHDSCNMYDLNYTSLKIPVADDSINNASTKTLQQMGIRQVGI